MGQRPQQIPHQRNYTEKHMKGCFTSYVIREMQIKTMRYLLEYRPKSRTLTTSNADKNMEQQEPSFIPGGNTKWYIHSGRQFGSILQN